MTLPPEIRHIIDEKNWNELDDQWTEMLLNDTVTVETLIEISDALRDVHEKERALTLLEMLAQHLESLRRNQAALTVYKKMLFFARRDTQIRPHIIRLYKAIHAKSEHIHDYIEISGLMRDEPILKSLQRLEDFLTYDIGTDFYFERYGIGSVVEVNPGKREIVIDFEKKKRHFLTIDVARGLLAPIDKDHFLYLKSRNIEELRRQIDTPVDLIKKILADIGEPLTAPDIKAHLRGIVDDRLINKTWERARKKLAKDSQIRIFGHAAKKYAYLKAGTDKNQAAKEDFVRASLPDKYLLAEEFVRTSPGLFSEISDDLVRSANRMYGKYPGLAIEIQMLCNDNNVAAQWQYDIGMLLEQHAASTLLHGMHNADHQQRTLALLKDRYGTSWPQEFKKLFFQVEQPRLFDGIAALLAHLPQMLADIHFMVFSMSKDYQQHYQWMLKRIQGGELPEYLQPSYLPRIIESLNYVKGIRGTVMKILSLDRFDTYIENAQEDEAKRIFNAIQSNGVLAEYQKRDFMRIIEHHFPDFFRHEDKTIYATEMSLQQKKKELDHLINIDIPTNKKEISRAREFGDLSENFEYKAAKERQAQLFEKVRLIENALTRVRLIKPEEIDTNTVTVGCRVKLAPLTKDETVEYTILGRWDIDLSKNVISNEAPVALVLLGKGTGHHVVLNEIEYKIVEIANAFI